MSLATEFKEFLQRGNVVELATAVVIGGAFGAVVTSFVENIIMPVVGLVSGGTDLSGMKIVLQAGDEAREIAEVAIGYGLLLNALIAFIIVAAVIFLMVKGINKLQKPAEEPVAEPAGPSSEELLAEIRDLLKAGRD